MNVLKHEEGVQIPEVSIVMAAYNEENKISRALDSIVVQTFTDWELIVVDDGSIDRTAEIVQRYVENDARICLVCNKTNLKLSSSLNKGINIAKANLIARADADDVNLPDRLAKQFDYLQKNNDIDVLGTGAYLLDDAGERAFAKSLPQDHAELQKLPFLSTHFFHPSVMIRRRFFRLAGIYDDSYPRAQDKELWLRGLRAGCRYANLVEPLIEYDAGGYVRSWRSIVDNSRSLFRMAGVFGVKWRTAKVLLSFARSAAVKMRVYNPKSLR